MPQPHDKMQAFDKYEHEARKTRPKFPFHEKEWKVPGWTGHKTEVGELYGGTPIYQQLNTKEPVPTSTLVAPKVKQEPTNHTIFKDPANDSTNWIRAKPDNLFPSLVEKAANPGNPPFLSSLVFGDDRYANGMQGVTGYTSSYKEMCDSLKEKRLIKEPEVKPTASGMPRLSEMTTEQVKHLYEENHKRVSRDMIVALRESLRTRISGKIKPGNNSNSFMLRQLFKDMDKIVDKNVEIDEFQLLLETFGMQLKRQDAIALFSFYDKDCSGVTSVEEFMSDMLDGDYYALFSRSVVPEREVAEELSEEEEAILKSIKDKLMTKSLELRKVLRNIDTEKSGVIDQQELRYGLRSLNIVDVSEAELEFIMAKTDKIGDGHIDINKFVNLFGTFRTEDLNPLGATLYTSRERSGLNYIGMEARVERIKNATLEGTL